MKQIKEILVSSPKDLHKSGLECPFVSFILSLPSLPLLAFFLNPGRLEYFLSLGKSSPTQQPCLHQSPCLGT